MQVKCIGSLQLDTNQEVVKDDIYQRKRLCPPNERGNGPKARIEGGDQTDDISINDPDSLLRPKLAKQPKKKDTVVMPKYTKPALQPK